MTDVPTFHCTVQRADNGRPGWTFEITINGDWQETSSVTYGTKREASAAGQTRIEQLVAASLRRRREG
jgi:hypothetical protein